MNKFKQWLEDLKPEPSEYDLPDEEEMNRIRRTPLRCDCPPNMVGDRFRFKMPMGDVESYVVAPGSVIGTNAPRGSLNARCMQLMNKQDCQGLYRLLQFVKQNSNYVIRSQLRA